MVKSYITTLKGNLNNNLFFQDEACVDEAIEEAVIGNITLCVAIKSKHFLVLKCQLMNKKKNQS